jgi:hypothetical protein
MSAVIGSLVFGCVSLDAVGTTPPSVTPTLGRTPSPLVTAVATPAFTPSPLLTLPPTATPTVAPTDTPAPPSPTIPPLVTPTPAPTDEVTPEPTASPDASSPDLLFDDPMDDPASGWGTGQTGGGLLQYSDGALQFDSNPGGAWIWSRRDAGSDNSALKVVGEFTPASAGKFGMICAHGDAELFGAIVDTDGGWAFISIGANGADILLDDENAGLDVPIGATTVVGLDCAGTSTGALRMVLNLTGTGPIAIYESQDGPASFDRVAAYAESFDDAFSVRLENAVAFGTGDPSGEMDADATDLLSHVPQNWQDTCFDTALPPVLGQHATAVITCFIGDVSSGSDLAEYVQFPTKEDMDAAYDLHVDRFPVDSPVDSCKDGPGEHSYTIGSEDAGRVLCADQFVGMRVDWTDDRLNILSTLVDHDGSFEDAFQDWLDGGPNV